VHFPSFVKPSARLVRVMAQSSYDQMRHRVITRGHREGFGGWRGALRSWVSKIVLGRRHTHSQAVCCPFVAPCHITIDIPQCNNGSLS